MSSTDVQPCMRLKWAPRGAKRGTYFLPAICTTGFGARSKVQYRGREYQCQRPMAQQRQGNRGIDHTVIYWTIRVRTSYITGRCITALMAWHHSNPQAKPTCRVQMCSTLSTVWVFRRELRSIVGLSPYLCPFLPLGVPGRLLCSIPVTPVPSSMYYSPNSEQSLVLVVVARKTVSGQVCPFHDLCSLIIGDLAFDKGRPL